MSASSKKKLRKEQNAAALLQKQRNEQAAAKKLKIHSIILEAVKKEMPDFGKDSVDAFGLSEFLQTDESDDNKQEEQAFADFRPLSLEIQSVKTGKHRRQADISMKKNGGVKHKEKEIEQKEKKEREKKENDKKKKTNNKQGNGTGKVSEVFISNVKTPFDNTSEEYKVSFTADESASALMLSIRIGSDDDNLSRAEIAHAAIDGKKCPIKNGMIDIGTVSVGERKTIVIKLSEGGRKTLEVRAYAES